MQSTVFITPSPSSTSLEFDPSRNFTPCVACNKNTSNVVGKKIGLVTMGWCLCLFACSAILWLYPCCTDSCKDTELTCSECKFSKVVVPAKCC